MAGAAGVFDAGFDGGPDAEQRQARLEGAGADADDALGREPERSGGRLPKAVLPVAAVAAAREDDACEHDRFAPLRRYGLVAGAQNSPA